MKNHPFLRAEDKFFAGFEYETVQKNQISQSLIRKSRRAEPLVYYRD